jgi:predicted transcriptional regulator
MTVSMIPVPNQPATKHMSFRIEDQLKQDVTHIAAAKDEKVSDVVRRAFEAYRDENRGLL